MAMNGAESLIRTLVAGGVGAVAVVSDHDLTAVTAVTAARQWHGTLDGHSGIPGSRDALVAGLITAIATLNPINNTGRARRPIIL